MSISSTTSRWVERRAGAGGGEDKQPFEELTGYIPVEAVTIFLALVSLVNGLEGLGQKLGPLPLIGLVDEFDAYIFCGIIIVPLVVLLVKKAKEKRDKVTAPFPYWPIAAGILAYSVWGLTVPGVFESPVLHVVAAPCAIIVSKILSLFEGVFG